MATNPPVERIPEYSGDAVTIAPPTFLERWGVIFVSIAGLWILLVGSWLFCSYLHHVPPLPDTGSMSPDRMKDAIAVRKQLTDETFGEYTPVFDLLVTKTVLPIVTLLLGYLFGKTKNQ